ncbi:uncharacterized protein LOC130509995 [Raphanus sativus]|uniref:Uncharacterized protein LOC108845226 n=1 Tax=Raphanus sativus TaxID=3726 RepID=A0A9W3DEQ6_RAPSA|nr:uncharacterized protein LOC108845226 [Raphanus sativus]XP_056862311.1 uncharacterized protein LOC130509995 [Raphanus sativus]
MAYNFVDYLRNIWSVSMFDTDLRDSKEIVNTLSVPESTKTFVFAIKVPEHDSTIYILSAQNFSLRSVIDAECLIRELRPDAVVTQVNGSDLREEAQEMDDGSNDSIPTSAFKVLTRCFLDKTFNKEKYESVAGKLVLKEIFGTSFNGHVLAVKKVAEEVGSSFMVLDSPFIMESLSKSLKAQYYYGSAITNDAHALMLKLLTSHSTHLSKEISPSSNLANETKSDSPELPLFAYSIYNLLVTLHNIFNGRPAIRKALDSATKMLSDVNRGETIDKEALLSEVYLFRTAVEGIRIALNNSGRQPIRLSNQTQVQFSKLSSTEKSYALMADSLRDQAKKFKNIVAVVDAGNLAGLRRHWRTCVPQEVKDMSTEHTLLDCSSNDSNLKPIAAVGAGALKLTKAVSAFKALAPLKLFLRNTQKAMFLGKTSLSSEIIRFSGVTEYILSSAQDTSLFSVQATLYTMIIRRRRATPIGTLPVAMFGVSLATFAGLLYYEKGIMCAAETLPSAPSIAKLGRGIQNLREASQEVIRRENKRIPPKVMEGLSQRVRDFTLRYSLSFSFKTKFGSY